jgi:Asp-tRNA(Asn)/Glu-tRNA(Gln) amidotransferase C subunit
MTISRPNPQLVRQLAAAVDLPLEPGAAEELAPQLGQLVEFAELLESLDLAAVEPAWAFSLDAVEP